MQPNWPGTSRKRAREDDENRTKANYDALKVPALREMCRAKKLKQTGLKADLICRLMQADHPSEPPDQADQPPDWLSAKDIDNMYAESPHHYNTMKRLMERAESRTCNVTGMTPYKISAAPPMRHPQYGVYQVIY